jgi:hypothetical protein
MILASLELPGQLGALLGAILATGGQELKKDGFDCPLPWFTVQGVFREPD